MIKLAQNNKVSKPVKALNKVINSLDIKRYSLHYSESFVLDGDRITRSDLIKKIIAILAKANYDLPLSTIENRLETIERETIYFYDIIPAWDKEERFLKFIHSNFNFDEGITNKDIIACFVNMVIRWEGLKYNKKVDGFVPMLMGNNGSGKTSFSEFLCGTHYNWFSKYGATSVYSNNPDLSEKKEVIILTASTIIANIDELCAWKRKDYTVVKNTVNADEDKGRYNFGNEEIVRVRGFNVIATTNEKYPLLEADRRFMFFHGKPEYTPENPNTFWYEQPENNFWQFWAEIKHYYENNIIGEQDVKVVKTKAKNIAQKYCFNKKIENANDDLRLDVSNFLENLSDDFVDSEIIRNKYYPNQTISQCAKEWNSFICKIIPNEDVRNELISRKRINGERHIFWDRVKIIKHLN